MQEAKETKSALNVAGDRSRAKGDCDRGKTAYAGKAGLSRAAGTHY